MIPYEYRPDRKASNSAEFLMDFHGWLHANGHPSYHSVPAGAYSRGGLLGAPAAEV